MKGNLQAGIHPDADQIATFVEGAAAAWEREQMLAHLAECAECRRVVFLMQGQEETETAAGAVKVAKWRQWRMPLGVAGAALACGLAVVVYVESRRGAQERAQMSAKVEAPEIPLGRNATGAAGAGAERTAKPGTAAPRRERGSAESLRFGVEAGARMAIPEPAPESRSTVASAPGAQAGTGGALGVAGSIAGANVVPAPAPRPAPAAATQAGGRAAPADGTTTTIQTENRNFAALKLAAPRPEPSLRIEHNRGPDDGLSEVTGRVTDLTGAAVAGATVALRDTTGTTRQTMSSADGSFSVAAVPPGHYDLRVTARGFETYAQAMDLMARDMAMLDTKLTVGAESQTVAVAANSLAVQTDSNVVNTQIGAEQQSEIATRNRNFAALAPLGLGAVGNAKMTVTLGKRVLSLDEAGTVFVSHNGGKKWKKVKSEWAGKVARIELMNAGAGSAAQFQLATDAGVVWTSEDGVHWRAK